MEGNFELKHPTIQLLHSSRKFTGLSYEDLQRHIQTFLEIADTFIATVSANYVRLMLFPFSLLGKAESWLLAKPTKSFTSWDDLARKFLTRFFPPGKKARLRKEIISFRQKNGENLFSQNSPDCQSKKAARIIEVDNYTALSAQIEAMRDEFKNFTMGQAQP
ncbi:uncharacterized protein LOC132038555 [Lycium ferocissimum]|uniref:uncharacterized protein LOC132038555 n=1 Tax=Lycium ferocissimum TaxID=112874 RepID=UPI002815E723|nr:uncharacterized protein LOC132038555 [Lycium ferocissimum]